MDTLDKKDTLIQHFFDVRKLTMQLCAPLKTEDYVVQPIDFVSPPKWHLGHTTWFFETFLLEPYQKDYQVFNKDYSYVFNSYYESVGKRVIRTNRGNLTRPTVEEILAYRAYVDKAMEKWLVEVGNIPEKARKILTLGLHHEQQHQELLVYDIKYILGTNPLFPPYKPMPGYPTSISPTAEPHYLTIEEGLYDVGHKGEGFCFDNELGRHKVFIPGFQVMDRLITNREYLAFIQDGGYDHFQYWLSDGWQWVQTEHVNAPLYWHYIAEKWFNYTLEGLKPIDMDAPVTHISFYEADAFAQWKGKRLLTEFEWEIACERLSPTIPVNANFMEQDILAPVKQEKGNLQFYGDAWEWTSSAYRPYPYFKAEEGALGEYNGKFMINQMVLRGGSCATPKTHIRASYRNFYQPYHRWHFTGIRLAQNL